MIRLIRSNLADHINMNNPDNIFMPKIEYISCVKKIREETMKTLHVISNYNILT